MIGRVGAGLRSRRGSFGDRPPLLDEQSRAEASHVGLTLGLLALDATAGRAGGTRRSGVPYALRGGSGQPPPEIVAQLAGPGERARALEVIERLEGRPLQ